MSEQKQHSWPRRALAENPALLVSLIYFVASVIGLVYSWAFLRAFGINVFRYAEVSDFLLASLKEPFTWILAVLAVILVAVDNANSIRVQRRGPGRFFKWYSRWYGSERYRQLNYIVSVFLVVIFLFLFAAIREEEIRDGEGEMITVTLADSSPPKQVTILGTTARFVFLYDHNAKRVDIHPNEGILTITKISTD